MRVSHTHTQHAPCDTSTGCQAIAKFGRWAGGMFRDSSLQSSGEGTPELIVVGNPTPVGSMPCEAPRKPKTTRCATFRSGSYHVIPALHCSPSQPCLVGCIPRQRTENAAAHTKNRPTTVCIYGERGSPARIFQGLRGQDTQTLMALLTQLSRTGLSHQQSSDEAIKCWESWSCNVSSGAITSRLPD